MHKLLGALVPAALIVFLPTLALAGNNTSRPDTSHDTYKTFNAHDFSKNSDDYYKKHSSRDKTPPVITAHDDVTATSTSSWGVAVSYTLPTAADNSGGSVPVSCFPASGSFFRVGESTVRCSAQDKTGNKSTISFTVKVIGPPSDHTSPTLLSLHIQSSDASSTIAVPGDTVTITFTASEEAKAYILVPGKKPPFVSVVNTGGNSWQASYPVGPNDREGLVNYIITLRDASHNVFVCSAANRWFFVARCPTTDGSSVTIYHAAPQEAVDTTPPDIQGASNITVDADSVDGTVVSYDLPTAVDGTDGTVAVSCTPAPGALFPVGDTTVTCSAQDTAGNTASATFTVTVNSYVPPDTVPPVIGEHNDLVVETPNSAGTIVTYDLPTAVDDVSGPVPVSCTPASGSLFPLGDMLVICSAQDAAGNNAATTFTVTVTFVPQPFTMATQPDQSTFCTPDWSTCYSGGLSQRYIELGQGSGLGHGTILSVTVAKAVSGGPWIISLLCYTDATYTATCNDWVAGNTSNGGDHYRMEEFATSTTDNIHWTAYFTNPTNESNFNGSSPVVFNPAYYYKLRINDNGWNVAGYGSATTEPYWVLTGMTTP